MKRKTRTETENEIPAVHLSHPVLTDPFRTLMEKIVHFIYAYLCGHLVDNRRPDNIFYRSCKCISK